MSNDTTTPRDFDADFEGSVEAFEAEFVQARITKIVDGLRRLASDIERNSAPMVEHAGRDGRHRYADIAAEVQHTLAWGTANLNLDQLTRHAGAADGARATRLAEQKR